MPRQAKSIGEIFEEREERVFEEQPMHPPNSMTADSPIELARASQVSARILLPGSVAAELLTAFPGTFEDAITTACVTILKLGATSSQVRPIVLTDEHRRSLEAILAVSLFSAEQVIERVGRLSEISVANPQGNQIASIQLDPIIVERLHSRSIGKFHEFVEETIHDLIRQYVNL